MHEIRNFMQKLDILSKRTGIIVEGRFVWNLNPTTFYISQSCPRYVITYHNV